MLFASTVLNYVDRQTLSILVGELQRDLGMSDIQYAQVVQLFLIAYTFAYFWSGWLTDKLGPRAMLALCISWWSLASITTGFVRSVSELGIARAALGLGEAGNYTVAPKAISEYFPSRERALALGIVTAGAMVGATIAPPLIGGLAQAHGWRMAFMITGAMGFVWLIGWLFIYPKPQAARTVSKQPTPWRAIFRERPVWGFATARLLADPVWYFYLFWFPKYLIDEQGLDLIEVASLVWIVYLAADFGAIGGGVFSDYLVKRGLTSKASRLIAMACAAAIAPLGILIASGPGLATTLALAASVVFAHQFLQVNIGTLVVDTYRPGIVATVFGIIAAGSGLGGIFSTQLVGQIVETSSFSSVFILIGFLHPAAFLVGWIAIRGDAKSDLRRAADV